MATNPNSPESRAALPSPPPSLIEALAAAESVLVTSHANPDGDAVGSQSALARGLESLGKRVLVWNHDPTPTLYQAFTEGIEWTVSDLPPAADFDLLFYVECPTPERTGHEQVPSIATVVNVDHHLGNTDYGHHNWVVPEAASVSILIHDLLLDLNVTVTEDMADGLLLGLTTDTGGFRFSNTTAAAHRSAAEMLEAGGSPERIARRIYESRSAASVRLLGEVLQTLDLSHGGRVATITLTHDHLQAARASRQDTEGLIDYPRSIDGVDIAVLYRELDNDRFKISLRSRGETSVEAIARRHGGGGHRNAAGCELSGPLDSARAALRRDFEAALRTEASS